MTGVVATAFKRTDVAQQARKTLCRFAVRFCQLKHVHNATSHPSADTSCLGAAASDK
jgi:hypothetical protein